MGIVTEAPFQRTLSALILSAVGLAFIYDKAGKHGTTPDRIEEILAFGYLTGGTARDAADPPNSISKTGAPHD